MKITRYGFLVLAVLALAGLLNAQTYTGWGDGAKPEESKTLVKPTAAGPGANVTGQDNVAVGGDAGRLTESGVENKDPTGSVYIGAFTKGKAPGVVNEVVIGHSAVGAGSNTVTIGNASTTATYLKGNVYSDGDAGLAAHTASTSTAVHGLGTISVENVPLVVGKGGTGQNASTAALIALGGMKTDGSNAAAVVALPGALKVDGTTELNGVASAVKILGNPAAPVTSVDGKAGLDIWSRTLILGANDATNIRGDGNVKFAALACPHVTNAEQPHSALTMTNSTTGNNFLSVGGGNAAFNAYEVIRFYTAPNVTTLTGLERARFSKEGYFGLATTTPQVRFHSVGDARIDGNASIATASINVGYALSVGTTIATGGVYVMGDVSAESFTDRSDAPESLAEAYAIIQSHETKDGKVDHAKLHASAWGTKYRAEPTGKTIVKWRSVEQELSSGEKISVPESYEEPEIAVIPEPYQGKRNLSMVISAQALVISDLTKRIEALEAAR